MGKIRNTALNVEVYDVPGVDALIEGVENRIDELEILGRKLGTFTLATRPSNVSGFVGIKPTEKDWVILSDEGGITVIDTIAGGGAITWGDLIAFATDTTGKIDLVIGATAGNFPVLNADGSISNSTFNAASFMAHNAAVGHTWEIIP